MPTFEIEQYEIHVQKYRVEAESEAQAIKLLFDGQAEPVDNGLEYIDVALDFGLPADEYPELAKELQKLDIDAECVIPSIRWISQVDVP